MMSLRHSDMASSSPKRVNLHGSGIPERHHMNERSFYEEHAAPLALPPLQGEHRAGVAIVGGGLAGLSTAASLLARGVRDLMLLEAEQLGSGASGRNGGFVMEGFSLSPQALLRQLGAEAARSLYGASRDAVALVRQRIVEHGIDCQRTEGGALWLDWFDTPASRQRMQAHAGLLRERFGVEWDAVDREQVRRWLDSPRYGGALWERGAFHFQPLRYVRGLAVALQSQGLRICEASPVRELVQHGSGWRLQTGTGVLHAEQVLLAGGATLRGVHAGVERARLPIATYVVCSEPLAPARQVIHTDAALYDNRFAFDYYRRLQDGRILWGGRISIRERRPEAIAALLKRDLLRVFPPTARSAAHARLGRLDELCPPRNAPGAAAAPRPVGRAGIWRSRHGAHRAGRRMAGRRPAQSAAAAGAAALRPAAGLRWRRSAGGAGPLQLGRVAGLAQRSAPLNTRQVVLAWA
jgi:gamma-glutamylputrescine oxidase